MVTVNQDYPLREDGSLPISEWLERLNIHREAEQMQMLCTALELCAEQEQEFKTPLGDSVLTFGLEIAENLISLNMDTDTLCAAIVYPSVQYGQIKISKISDRLGKVVAKLVKGVTGMDAIRSLQSENSAKVISANDLERLRKMLLAMVDDTRVVVIKLSERLQTLRAAKNIAKDQRLALATEIQDIYSPLANRLGVGQIKWEMEDLSFRYQSPDEYLKIAKKLSERRTVREKFIEDIIHTLESELAREKIKGTVEGRAKHIYSIYKKMQRKGVSFEEIYDARAVRIQVSKMAECYAALGIVHSLWPHIPKEFDDYIATPKSNGYQSIHTAVIGPGGKALEVQIRTYKMHQESEHGIAAHWRYKEGNAQSSADQASEKKIAWLRELLEWQEGVASTEDVLEQFQQTIIEDRVYVFTPDGLVVDLPPGGTALDFAYHVHTELGHHCIGAKVNGKLVPLTQGLETGQTVEVLRRNNAQPSRDWLNRQNGYLKSNRARQKVNHWFRKQNREINIEAGKPMLIRELERNNLSDVDLAPVAKRLNLKSIDDLYAAVGMGDLGTLQVSNMAASFNQTKLKPKSEVLKITTSRNASKGSEVTVLGVGNLLCHMAGCCRPVPGDKIIGYVTQGRGVAVHRQDCHYMLQTQSVNSGRLVDMAWSDDAKGYYSVDLFIKARDRRGLLKDLTSLLSVSKINVLDLSTHVNTRLDETEIALRIEVSGNQQLEKVITEIRFLKNVIDVSRKV
jgi:GTP pyrophosphokinase